MGDFFQFCRLCVAKILPFKNKTLPLIETNVLSKVVEMLRKLFIICIVCLIAFSCAVMRNAVGSVAENFEFADYDLVVDLNHICDASRFYRDNYPEFRDRKMLMLVFFNGDSKECKDGIEGLGNSSVVMRLAESFVLSVDLICVEGFYRELRSEFKEKYPYLGIVHTYRSDIVKNNLYAMSHYPSIYILDLNGVVLLKDASVSSAIQFLIEQQERISTKTIN